MRRNPKGRGFPGDLLCRVARPWGLPRASRRFAHLIPESLRRGHAGLMQRFLNVAIQATGVGAISSYGPRLLAVSGARSDSEVLAAGLCTLKKTYKR